MNDQTINANTLGTLSSNGFSRSGYIFNGWNTEADGSGTTYNDASKYYAAAGTNTNSTTLYAQWIPMHNITVNFSGGGITSVTFAGRTSGTISSSGGTISLVQGAQYTITMNLSDEYEFSSWTLSSGSGTISSTSTNPTTFTVGDGVATIVATGKMQTTFSQAFTDANKSQQDGYYKMQDMQSSICSSVSSGQTTTLIDTRDNKTYSVGKLTDGHCWLLDNLDLRISNSTVLSAMSNSNTNASDDTLDRLKAGNGTTSDKYSTGKIQYWNSVANSYSVPYTRYNTSVPTDSTSTTGGYTIGSYYNYCAATAGSYCYGNGSSSYGSSVGNAGEDICPSNWRLPQSSEYYTLYHQYNYSTLRTTLHLPLSGYVDKASEKSKGSYGYFWSSTRQNNYYMQALYLTGSSVSPQSNQYRYYGYSVRCVAK